MAQIGDDEDGERRARARRGEVACGPWRGGREPRRAQKAADADHQPDRQRLSQNCARFSGRQNVPFQRADPHQWEPRGIERRIDQHDRQHGERAGDQRGSGRHGQRAATAPSTPVESYPRASGG